MSSAIPPGPDPDAAAEAAASPAVPAAEAAAPSEADATPAAAAPPWADRVVRARPVRLRRVAAVAAAAVVVTFAVIALLLGGTISEGVLFGPADQAAMVILGLLLAGGVLLLARPSLVADGDGLHVRNILASHDVPWEVVREVAFRDGSPWATLELADDDQLALLAVQASDGARSVAVVRALRALQARHAAAGGEDPAPDERSHGVI